MKKKYKLLKRKLFEMNMIKSGRLSFSLTFFCFYKLEVNDTEKVSKNWILFYLFRLCEKLEKKKEERDVHTHTEKGKWYTIGVNRGFCFQHPLISHQIYKPRIDLSSLLSTFFSHLLIYSFIVSFFTSTPFLIPIYSNLSIFPPIFVFFHHIIYKNTL